MKNEDSKLAGKEVYLRRPKTSDFEEITALYKASRTHLRGFVDPQYDRKTYDQLLVNNAAETTEFFFICQNSNDAIAGTITLSQIFRKGFQNAYLGYLLGVAFTGKGYMSEAVRLILRFAFLDLKLHRVEANVQLDNDPSRAVLKRNGFTKEGFSRKYLKIGGQWRDHERWAIVKEDWKSKL